MGQRSGCMKATFPLREVALCHRCPACRTCQSARPAPCPRAALQHTPPAAVAVLTTLAGATSPQKIIAFMALQRERLNAVLGTCFQRAPAVNTPRPLLLALSGGDLEAAFPRHVRSTSCFNTRDLNTRGTPGLSRLTYVRDTRTGLWATREEVGYSPCRTHHGAKVRGGAVRARWSIENPRGAWHPCQRVRDLTLGQDASCTCTQPGIVARIRSVALTSLCANGVQNSASRSMPTPYANAVRFDQLPALGLA